jgi:hypothetical protein
MELPLIFSLFGLVVMTLIVPAIIGIARRGRARQPQEPNRQP